MSLHLKYQLGTASSVFGSLRLYYRFPSSSFLWGDYMYIIFRCISRFALRTWRFQRIQ